jgi:RHH-type transcriptional regulator, proline utilization regulon repressor / proline dehydrogenase / delta 1-pyrroline-5-carboxylate dehydrogenase
MSPLPNANAIDLNGRIRERGRRFFASIQGEAPSVFNKSWWTGKVMEAAMQSECFKVQFFRFMDVLPCMSSSESLLRHIREYFGGDDQELPQVLKWGARNAGFGSGIAGKLLGKTIRSNIESMATQFMIGENMSQAMRCLNKLRKDGFASTVDILGEATVNEREALQYQTGYLELMDGLRKESAGWKGLSSGGALDWGHAPMLNISIKPSALFSLARPMDFEGSVQGIADRLSPVLRKAMEIGAFLCIDMEQHRYKDITLEVFRRLRSAGEFRGYPHLGIVLQSYLRDTDRDLDELLAWSAKERLPISIRLVKGAYWDFETVSAKQRGLKVPVWTHKAETDAAFERQARKILERHELCHLACASHNVRSIAMVLETAAALKVPDERYEFQVLYGMAEPIRKGLLNVAGRVRLYSPYGELLPGMAYLVRRLLENTSNESFLRQSFVEGEAMDRLLEDPTVILARQEKPSSVETVCSPPPFANEPMADFTLGEERQAFGRAIAQVRSQLGRTYPLFIGGKEVFTDDRMASVNPASPGEVVGHVCQAGVGEIQKAVDAARTTFPEWRGRSPEQRANLLLAAAEVARKRIHELAAWQILEVGKQWDQAQADVAEAIDFLEYYAREIVRLGTPRRMGRAPGEMNLAFYQPKGIAAVIAPWNFPLAISCGMASAAMAAGNCVLFKPAGPSSVIGAGLAQIFRDAGLPDGVFNFVPGRSRIMGDFLVDHPQVAMIAFTGSKEVGLRIIERAARVAPGQTHVKRVIAEMGGKNAAIVDDDADLDEVVPEILYSAFGFQGQKCSATSRVIVLSDVYERFTERLVEAARSLRIGPAEDPQFFMGPVVERSAQERIRGYVELGRRETTTLLVRDDLPEQGFYAPLSIFGDVPPDHRLAQEEIFGPVLSVLRARDFDQALDMANGTEYALTGAVFSRSPERLERAFNEFRVGNLYLNRGSTGALVERQPFGGFKMSGVGSKAGGPDYLLQFMDPRVVTENTMRRGFTPIFEGDDWVG